MREIYESQIEQKLKKTIEAAGGRCIKFTAPGLSGVPDRLCLFPGGKAVFVETKAPGGKLRPLQRKRHEELQELGFKVLVIDSEERIKEVVPK
jgi:hypothetical protein